jgi:translation initiation factor 4A
LVLDEADVMLSSVFKEQVHSIFDYLHRDVKIALFTATLPAYMQPLLNKIMQDPVIIQVKPEALTLDGIRQYYLSVNNDKDKFEQLKDLFRHLSLSQTIIYCNSVKRVEDLYNSMNIEGYAVSMIHSNMTPDMRKKNFSDFKEGNTRVLISTDVTARGIDIQQVSIVINYDLPKCVHKYLHRIGRSGRWGRKGVGINFVTYHDQHKMQELEYFYQIKIKVLPENFGITL